MLGHTLHPNSRAMLTAWRSLSAHRGAAAVHDPMVEDCRGLLGRLFVLNRVEPGVWIFRNAGERLSALLGRELLDQDFLSLWQGPDRIIATGIMAAIETALNPAILRARGETLTGRRVEVEIPLAPLEGQGGRIQRVLGLYQALGGEAMLEGRPIVRHHLCALSTPDVPVTMPKLRLVASND